jgi:hypothetical protein
VSESPQPLAAEKSASKSEGEFFSDYKGRRARLQAARAGPWARTGSLPPPPYSADFLQQNLQLHLYCIFCNARRRRGAFPVERSRKNRELSRPGFYKQNDRRRRSSSIFNIVLLGNLCKAGDGTVNYSWGVACCRWYFKP